MTKIGKISRRPMIMHRERTSLLKGEKAEKLPAGPTAPSPGPVLLMQVMTEVRVSVKGKSFRATTREAPRVIMA